MSEDYIIGMLAGSHIEIACTKLQGKLLRGRLSDWLDESTRVDKHLGCKNWPNCDSEGCGEGK